MPTDWCNEIKFKTCNLYVSEAAEGGVGALCCAFVAKIEYLSGKSLTVLGFRTVSVSY